MSAMKSRDDYTVLECDPKHITRQTVAYCFSSNHMSQLRICSFASSICCFGSRHKQMVLFKSPSYVHIYVHCMYGRFECTRWRFDSKDSRIQKRFSVHGVVLDKRHVLLEGCERLSSRENAKVSWYRFKENLKPRVVSERRTGGKRVGNEEGGALEVGGEGNGGGLAEHSEIGIPTT